MKVTGIDADPFDALRYARVKERNQGVEQVDLPFYNAYVDRLPAGLSAFIATSDLQGVAVEAADTADAKASDCYLGHAVAEKCVEILGRYGIASQKTGVLLAGDFHSDISLQKRGGFGDVRDVWIAFRSHFKWVVGVAGNHDTFGDHATFSAFCSTHGCHLLNGSTAVVDGIRFSGVSGVIGNPNKPWRHRETEHMQLFDQAIKSSPRFLILHEGPSIQEHGLPGNDRIRVHLENQKPTFVICGHRHWPGNAIHSLSNGMQVISTEGKVIVFRKNWTNGSHP